MADYRVYFLDAGNRIVSFEEANFETDARAVAYVDSIRAEHFGIEVWSGARRIGLFPGAKTAWAMHSAVAGSVACAAG